MSEIFRFSRRVPIDGVNLAWIDLPPLDVVENISLVETAKFIAENINLAWTEKLDPVNVLGVVSSTPTVTGNLYYTNYNPSLTNLSTSGSAISAGVSSYAIPRQPTATTSPSGFVIDNFTSEIRVLHPAPNDTGVWRLRIQDGVIVRHHILRSSDNSWLRDMFSVGDELVLFYSTPFALRIPYRNDNVADEDAKVVEVSGVIATVIDERTLQLPNQDLYQITSLLINNQQQITNTSGQIAVATATAASVDPPAGPFTAWDPVVGTLTLNRTISEKDIILVNYRYREYLYTYEGFLDDSNVFHDLDLNPSKGHYYDNGNPTSDLLNIPIYLYLIPTAAYRFKDSGGNFTQDRTIYTADRWTNNFLRWEKTYNSVANNTPIFADACRKRYTFGSAHFGSATFVDSISVDTLTLTASGTGLANLPSAIILAKLYVTSNGQIENTHVLDTRSRGGGIPENVVPDDVKLPGATRREIGTYWDIAGWDGQPVPLGGVLLVELPGGLLTGTGGYPLFSQREIEQIVNQHVGAGVRVIIRYI